MDKILFAVLSVVVSSSLGCATSSDFHALYEQNLTTAHKQAVNPLLSDAGKKAIEPLNHVQLDQLTEAAKKGGSVTAMAATDNVKSDADLKAAASQLTPSDVTALAQTQGVDATNMAKAAKDATDQQSFAGINFGAGAGVAIDLGGRHRVSDASVVNGIVRINEDSRVTPRVLMETHYFFTPEFSFLSAEPKSWGWGPFIGLQSSGEQVIDSLGFGVQLGFKVPDRGSSFNFGVGALVDPKAQVLGDGITSGQALPAGETQVRFKKEAKWSLLLEFSFTF